MAQKRNSRPIKWAKQALEQNKGKQVVQNGVAQICVAEHGDSASRVQTNFGQEPGAGLEWLLCLAWLAED